MFGKILLSGSVLSLLVALPSAAQTDTVIREAIPAQRQVIVANSPQDIALQEEIRKIRAYNAYVDSQIGVSGTIEVIEPVSTYSNAKIELFETQAAETTYANSSVTPVVTIIERKPLVGQAGVGQMGIHTIAEGDTLYGFARNRCVSVSDIQDLNNLEDANIRLGQKISLPASACHVITASTVTTENEYTRVVLPVPASVDTTRSYAVLPKDSLYSIGRQYCLTADDLAGHNGITTTKAIQPGQILRLPETACIK